MIQWFDDRVFKSKFLLVFIMLLIALPLVMWRMAGQFQSGANGKMLVKVNDAPIYSNDLQNTIRQVRERLQPLADINPDMVTDELVERQAMDELVSRMLVGQFVEENGMSLADSQVAQQIATMREFIQDGAFDQQRYQETLQNARLTPKEFEARVRGLQSIDQLQEALMDSEFATRLEQVHLLALVGETRDIGYLRLSVDEFLDEQSVIDEARIQTYYDERQVDFAVPETAKFEYLELDRAEMALKVTVDEEAIEAAYQSRLGEFTTDPEWQARHILLEIAADAAEAEVDKIMQQAEEIISRINNGASFAELAKEFSDDPGSAAQGGDLGFFGKGMMVAPFEAAVALLSIDEVSAPVKTRFGVHIIQLTAKKEERIKPLEAVRDKLVADLQAEEVENLFYDRQELLGTMTFENPGTLEPAAEVLGLSITETDFLGRVSVNGFFEQAKVKKSAFSEEVLRDRNNSAVLELSEGHVLVLRVKQHRPESIRPLNEVKETIIQALKKQEAKARAETVGKEIKTALLAGEEAETVAKRYHADWQRLGAIGRDNSVLDRSLQEVAFSLRLTDNPKEALEGSVLDDGSYALLQLFAVYPGEDNADLMVTQKERIQGRYARSEIEALLASLKDQADIVYADDEE